jgi:phosphopantothenoylcysteine decarboxylase/phosphopantothenate--cysteine ligase
MNSSSDLAVQTISDALRDKRLDVIVTGSIGAVEAVRFIRALRRLGAETHVWASRGALQFTTTTALSWAAGRDVNTDFSGSVSHIAQRDACVIAPLSANMIYKLAHGVTDTATSALACSYLGSAQPVLALANMHESMANAPAVAENLARLSQSSDRFFQLNARSEEGKLKFPDPRDLADQCAHRINAADRSPNQPPVLLCFGGTRAWIDTVRYLGNYSTGALGCAVASELYRRGFELHTLVGNVEVQPRNTSSLTRFESNDDLESAAMQILERHHHRTHLIFMAAVLDYIPDEALGTKLKSGIDHLQIKLRTTKKIIAKLTVHDAAKIAFKLEDHLDAAVDIASSYLDRYKLTMFIVNQRQDVSRQSHRALVFDATSKNPLTPEVIESKEGLAVRIRKHLDQWS